MKMDAATQHWPILEGLGNDLANKVREFMVIGEEGDGVMVATEDGQGFWFGKIEFGWCQSKTATKPTPLDVPDLVSMAQGYRRHILLLNRRGDIYVMGNNNRGLLGLGTEDEEIHFSPQLITSPHKFISVRCGKCHSLALTKDGKVWAWGWNDFGQVGVPPSTDTIPSPRQILELDPHQVVAVECGGDHSVALTDQGEVYTWGSNDWGQAGDGRATSQHTPTRILTPSPVKSIAAGHSHTLLLTRTEEVWAFGENRFDPLGLPAAKKSVTSLSKVVGLPPISQIAAHPATDLSIAMSSDRRCFVWGQLRGRASISNPLKLPPFYSTVTSPLSFFSLNGSTPHSVTIPETPPSRLSARMSRMFDNPETSPDVQFVVEQRTIHAHRIILSNYSDYFARMFSERWTVPVDPEDPIVKVTISDYSYEVFHAFMRFFYTDCLEVHFDLLPKLFELASEYLESDLQQLCLSRMRSTLTPATCCLYYPLTHRHSHPELASFQQELVQFITQRMTEVFCTTEYHSMDADLRANLAKAYQNSFPMRI